MDIQTISMIISVVGSAVYSTWTLGKRVSSIETRLESHIQTHERVSVIETAHQKERLDRLDKHIHDLRNQIQAITLMISKEHHQ